MGVDPLGSPEWPRGAHWILNAEEDEHCSLYTQSVIADFFFFFEERLCAHILHILLSGLVQDEKHRKSGFSRGDAIFSNSLVICNRLDCSERKGITMYCKTNLTLSVLIKWESPQRCDGNAVFK